MRDIVVYVYPGVAHRVLLREQNEVDRDELQMGARERAGADGMNSSCELSPRETEARVPRPYDEKEKEVTKMSPLQNPSPSSLRECLRPQTAGALQSRALALIMRREGKS